MIRHLAVLILVPDRVKRDVGACVVFGADRDRYSAAVGLRVPLLEVTALFPEIVRSKLDRAARRSGFLDLLALSAVGIKRYRP